MGLIGFFIRVTGSLFDYWSFDPADASVSSMDQRAKGGRPGVLHVGSGSPCVSSVVGSPVSRRQHHVEEKTKKAETCSIVKVAVVSGEWCDALEVASTQI